MALRIAIREIPVPLEKMQIAQTKTAGLLRLASAVVQAAMEHLAGQRAIHHSSAPAERFVVTRTVKSQHLPEKKAREFHSHLAGQEETPLPLAAASMRAVTADQPDRAPKSPARVVLKFHSYSLP